MTNHRVESRTLPLNLRRIRRLDSMKPLCTDVSASQSNDHFKSNKVTLIVMPNPHVRAPPHSRINLSGESCQLSANFFISICRKTSESGDATRTGEGSSPRPFVEHTSAVLYSEAFSSGLGDPAGVAKNFRC